MTAALGVEVVVTVEAARQGLLQTLWRQVQRLPAFRHTTTAERAPWALPRQRGAT